MKKSESRILPFFSVPPFIRHLVQNQILLASPLSFLFFSFNFYLFIYLLMAVLGLRFCVRAFSSCGKQAPFFIAVRGPLSRPLLLRSTGSRRTGSVVVAHGPSCSAACGILPDQGSNPCPLHWQADSQPLCHQGSPPHPSLVPATATNTILCGLCKLHAGTTCLTTSLITFL